MRKMRENIKRQVLNSERPIDELQRTMKDHNEASNKKGNRKEFSSLAEASQEDALEIEMVVEASEGEENLVMNEPTENDEGTTTSVIRVPFPTETRKKKKKKRSFTPVVGSTRERIRSGGGRRKKSARNVGALHPRKTRKSSADVVTVGVDSSNDDEYVPSTRYRKRTRSSRIKEPDYTHPRGELERNPLVEPVYDLAYRGSRNRKRVGHTKKKEDKKVAEETLVNNNVNESSEEEKRMLVEDLNIPSHLVVDSEEVLREDPPIWFRLVASNPKDVTMPASCIKKYLVRKLGLRNEDELEIKMRGAPVHPKTELHELVRLWMQTATGSDKERSCAVGSPGEDFVMVFAYSRCPGSSKYK
ncbi:OLC1v1019849C1 [Oldenlandia corymbosa var. corymbosa]|uniref:OLC1v1019849C1 n=1 Tax=Oldenlandia corymbosa var. corymbosa TaxID=529605 RepID=A0AAV1EFE6_OLDCO|nr:OLC1v1019849C1 [Oldenlandia corymbosa var. corymbosa]